MGDFEMKPRKRYVRIFKDQKPPPGKKKKPTKVLQKKLSKLEHQIASKFNHCIAKTNTSISQLGTAMNSAKSGETLFVNLFNSNHSGNPMCAYDNRHFSSDKGTDALKKAIKGLDGKEQLRKVCDLIKAPKEIMAKAMKWAETNASTATEKDMIRASGIHAILLSSSSNHYGRAVVSQLNKITSPKKCFTRSLAFTLRHLKFAAELFKNKGALLLWEKGIITE